MQVRQLKKHKIFPASQGHEGRKLGDCKTKRFLAVLAASKGRQQMHFTRLAKKDQAGH
jgi:hypothetical protein